MLRPGRDPAGYLFVNLYRDRRRVTRRVHVLVAAAFIGPRPPRMEVAHGDGDRANAALTNLRYATKRENCDDMIRHGNSRRGLKRAPRLTEPVVKEIAALLVEGQPDHVLSARFGVSLRIIAYIRRGRTWRRLTGLGSNAALAESPNGGLGR